MSHYGNVLVLGAGFSADAGIPLLASFVDTMLDIADRGEFQGKRVPDLELNLLRGAKDVLMELDSYHGRSNFNDRDIEDVLSILAFNVLGGARREKQKLETVTRAIARTIDITCAVNNPLGSSWTADSQNSQPQIYKDFWRSLFDWKTSGKALPTIISLNYDLVLERSLLQVLNGTTYSVGNSYRAPFRAFTVDYHHKQALNRSFTLEQAFLGLDNRVPGTQTSEVGISTAHDFEPIDILKLHGSLNFTKPRQGEQESTFGSSIEDPHIFPPISNKPSDKQTESIWRHALLSLRKARTVTFVGYSLPRTDTYMQYFLKAAFGPNYNLKRITVFDPVLFNGPSDAAGALKDRYQSIFATQKHAQIEFRPKLEPAKVATKHSGTALHFVATLDHCPSEILY